MQTPPMPSLATLRRVTQIVGATVAIAVGTTGLVMGLAAEVATISSLRP